VQTCALPIFYTLGQLLLWLLWVIVALLMVTRTIVSIVIAALVRVLAWVSLLTRWLHPVLLWWVTLLGIALLRISPVLLLRVSSLWVRTPVLLWWVTLLGVSLPRVAVRILSALIVSPALG